MKSCVIFCAGECGPLRRPIGSDEPIIAADGGFIHTQHLGLQPQIVLGDFDSLGFVPEGAAVFPVEKDDTDSMLAIRQGLAMGCRRFYLYGALDGQRVDHTMANFQALHFLADRGAQGYLIGKHQIVTAISGGAIEFGSECAGHFSVFALGGDAAGVCIRGAKYAMENGTLAANFPLGVSNQFVGQPVHIRVESGVLLLIWNADNGIW